MTQMLPTRMLLTTEVCLKVLDYLQGHAGGGSSSEGPPLCVLAVLVDPRPAAVSDPY